MDSLGVPGIRRRLGANVHRLRLGAKLTQVQASERAGLDLRHFQRIETADTNRGLTSIARVAFGLNVDISVLFKAPPRR